MSDRLENYKYPFMYGAQYYRAPTPSQKYWADDLRQMAESGFNSVKFWAQWRWSHRGDGRFFYDDLDELMDLAAANNLSVTINTIFDVGPKWVFRDYPDCKMVTSYGRVVEPTPISCRQIGGYPGPCYNHPEARVRRQEFMRDVVARYAGHPAMGMWDVWNEPESCVIYREPKIDTLLCYCPNCRREFGRWLQNRYQDIDTLNQLWGRCYDSFAETELPRDSGSFPDMIDWRLFCLDTLAGEAKWRLNTAKSIDAVHPVYLHPVPNTMAVFNSVTCVDDFQLARDCDCFGGTTNGVPVMPTQSISSAQGRVCYNVESHLRAGSTAMYPRDLSMSEFANTFLPQVGLGIRGFLHWQYRAETLGDEAPAWGLLDVDGSVGKTHAAAVEFWKRIQPVANRLMSAAPEKPEVAIYKSTSNEILHWCSHRNFHDLIAAVEGYTTLLYDKNVRFGYVDDRMLIDGLDSSIKLLIMPDCYALSQPVADAIAAWVKGGGTLLSEAHLGGYDLTTHRHSEIQPGLGLADAFGFRERNATCVAHLGLSEPTDLGINVMGDVAKAVQAFGLAGGMILYLNTDNYKLLLGWSRYAEIEGDNLTIIAGLPDRLPCAASKQVGNGNVYYIGTLAARMWANSRTPGLEEIVDRAMRSAGIKSQSEKWPWLPVGVRLDQLEASCGEAMVIWNRTDSPVKIAVQANAELTGLYTDQTIREGTKLTLAPGQAELLVPNDWLG